MLLHTDMLARKLNLFLIHNGTRLIIVESSIQQNTKTLTLNLTIDKLD